MNETNEAPDASQCLVRAHALMDRSRYRDAATWLQRGIQADPNSAECFSFLALCWMNLDDKKGEAVDAARRGVSLEPESPLTHGVLALTLLNQAKDGQDEPVREALGSAQQAIQLDPDSCFAQTTLARLYLRLRRWPEAEAAARKALELDTTDASAAEILSVALLQQGKHETNDELVRQQLQQHAEEDSAHSSAGWNALQKGDYRKANEHFMEALRLNPHHEGARLGLVESFRSRSWFYRTLIRFNAFLSSLTEGRQTAIWLGGYLTYRLLYGYLKDRAPLVASLLAGCWLLLVFWTALARGLSSLLMMLDRFARQCLRPKEKWEGIVVGGMAVLALIMFGVSFVLGKWVQMLALAMFLGAIPAASAFNNDHYIGKWFYWAVAGFCVVCAFYPLIAVILSGWDIGLPWSSEALLAGIVTAVAFSFVRMFNLGYR
jgi:tetratricopeptide (TPR) repeat protein